MIARQRYTPDDVLQALRRRFPWIVLTLCAATMATALASMRVADVYESEVGIQLVKAEVPASYVSSAVQSTLDERLPSITEQVLNGDRLRQIVKELGLYASEGKAPVGDTAELMRRDFRLRVASSNSFVVTFSARDARTAKAGAERLGEAFIDENRRRSEAVASAATQFLDAQLEDTRQRLEENERALTVFNERHAGELPSQVQSNVQLLQSAQVQLQNVSAALERDQGDAQALDRQIEESAINPPSAVAGSGRAGVDPVAVSPLEAARQQLAELLTRATAEHPDVVRLKRQISELERQAGSPASAVSSAATETTPSSPDPRSRLTQLRASRAQLDRQMAARRADAARVSAQITDYTRRLEAEPGRENELTALMRDYGTLKDVYTKLLAKKEEATISARLQANEIGEHFVLGQPARVPSRPASPNRPQLDIVGAVAGLMLGVGLAAFVEFRDTAIRSEEDLQMSLTPPVLATIPLMLTGRERRRQLTLQALLWLGLAGAVMVSSAAVWRSVR